jgi:hypothetical protein
MARRSPRKKIISSETIIESDDDFVAVASDDSYVSSFICLNRQGFLILSSIATTRKMLTTRMMMTAANLTVTTAKGMPRTAPQLLQLNQRMMISKSLHFAFLYTFLIFTQQHRNYPTSYALSYQSRWWEETRHRKL